MCYSAQVQEAYDEHIAMFGADIDIETFWRLYGQRMWDPTIKIPRAMDVAFLDPKSKWEEKIHDAIVAYQGKQVIELEAELAKEQDADWLQTVLKQSVQTAKPWQARDAAMESCEIVRMESVALWGLTMRSSTGRH